MKVSEEVYYNRKYRISILKNCVPDKKPLNQYVPVCVPNEMVPMPGF